MNGKLSPKKLNYMMVVCVLMLFFLGNVFTQLVTDLYQVKLDLTDQKLYALSDETFRVLDTTPTTELIIFANEEDYPTMTREIVAQYLSGSATLSVRYADPYQNPTLVDQYNQMGYGIAQNDIIVQGESREKHLTFEEMFKWNTDKTQIESVQVEQVLTSALLYVNQPVVTTASFLIGHNEAPSAALRSVFTSNNYTVKDISLVAADFSGEDIAIIASPSRDYATNEIEKIDAYLSAGGKLMVFMEPSVAQFPNLKGLLERWNIGVHDDVVVEPEIYMLNNPLNLVPVYMPHQINSYFSQNKFFMVLPQSRSLEVIGEQGAISTSTLLSSTADAYGKLDLQNATTEQTADDLQGPFALAVLSEKQVLIDGEERTAMVFAMGSQNVYADDLMGADSYANGSFFAETLSYMVDATVSVHIPSKSIDTPPLPITTGAAMSFAVVFAVVIPIGLIAYGTLVLKRRRKA